MFFLTFRSNFRDSKLQGTRAYKEVFHPLLRKYMSLTRIAEGKRPSCMQNAFDHSKVADGKYS